MPEFHLFRSASRTLKSSPRRVLCLDGFDFPFAIVAFDHSGASGLSEENLCSALHHITAEVTRDDGVTAQGQNVKPQSCDVVRNV